MGYRLQTPAVLWAALILGTLGCVNGQSPSSRLSFKGSMVESSEAVSLDPQFLARQKQLEKKLFGFEPLDPLKPHWSDPGDDEDILIEGPGAPNAHTLAAVASYLWPLEGVITSPFGLRRSRRGSRLHAGLDIGAPRGTPVRAARAGQVVTAKYKGAYGNVIVMLHDNGEQTVYAHLLPFSAKDAKEGQYVPEGGILGRVGMTGRATGYHVHFELRTSDGIPVDPLRQLPQVAFASQSKSMASSMAKPIKSKQLQRR